MLWLNIYQHLLVTIICSPFSLKLIGIEIPYLKKWFSCPPLELSTYSTVTTPVQPSARVFNTEVNHKKKNPYY